MTAKEMVLIVLKDIGVWSRGRALSQSDIDDAFDVLKMLLNEWGNDGIVIPHESLEPFAMIIGRADYDIGKAVGYDFDTVRPDHINTARVRDSGDTDHEVKIIGKEWFSRISRKTTPGRPEYLWYSPIIPNGKIWLYPVPDTTDDIYLYSTKPIVAPGAVVDSLVIPATYENMIRFNLGADVCGQHGLDTPPWIASRAITTLRNIKAANAARKIEPSSLNDLVSIGRRSSSGRNFIHE